MNILIADDQVEILAALDDVLTEAGHHLKVASDGQIAMDLLGQNSFDLALLDHNMPEYTGLELAKFIKQNFPKMRVVLMSGYPNMKEIFAKSAGVDVFLPKPFRTKEILDLISKFEKEPHLP